MGEADILRRAMGKKKADEMAKQQEIFVERATKHGFDAKKARELFDLMAYFAGYGFNKSHSAAYALIAYQTAYLKAHYPAEFMACLISLETANAENMAFYLQEARDMGIEILAPDINRSSIEFTACAPTQIMFGLQGIKSVGMAALENIIAERTAKGPFTSLFEFCKRIELRTSNKRVLEHLICAGAFDKIPGSRAQKVHDLEKIIDLAAEHKKVIATGQMGLFSTQSSATTQTASDDFVYQVIPDWADKEKLEKEKEVIGFYLSSHPLHAYKKLLSWLNISSFENVLKKASFNSPQEPIVIAAGLVKSKREIITKKGDRMAFVALEDMQSTAEIILFPATFKKVELHLMNHHIFLVKGALDSTSPQKCKIKANEMVPLDLFFQEWPAIHKLSCKITSSLTADQLQSLQTQFTKGQTSLEFIFAENGKQLRLTAKEKVTLTSELLEILANYHITPECFI